MRGISQTLAYPSHSLKVTQALKRFLEREGENLRAQGQGETRESDHASHPLWAGVMATEESLLATSDSLRDSSLDSQAQNDKRTTFCRRNPNHPKR
ncbi:hypothetical protein [Helicobacter marmotae]|uniref:hypothetical protein n=1 Tax=Helicobacter marmotae TaxID=152490 RepID=UPI0011C018DE|nr:hypothetical protein [Helicobacter marmotae]